MENFKKKQQVYPDTGQIDYRFNILGNDEDFFIPAIRFHLGGRQFWQDGNNPASDSVAYLGGEVELPKDFNALPDINRLIMAVEAAAYHKGMFNKCKDQYGTYIRSLIEEGLLIKGIDFAKALETRLKVRVEVASIARKFDGLVTPGATGAAPLGLDSTGSAAMQRP